MFVFRIQQIQLLGRDMRGSEHDQLWNQIEAEIHLHRHKTVIRACRGRKDPNHKTPAPPPPQPEAIDEEEDAESKSRKRRGIGEPRTVVINKDKTEGLGISITVRFVSHPILGTGGSVVDPGDPDPHPPNLSSGLPFFTDFQVIKTVLKLKFLQLKDRN